MTLAELRTLVNASGGAKPFASLLRVTPRVVYYWLDGSTPITPSREDQILRLAREQGWVS
jgi:DNA-binding transcriptional regulator YdaS (Cro superfamily)